MKVMGKGRKGRWGWEWEEKWGKVKGTGMCSMKELRWMLREKKDVLFFISSTIRSDISNQNSSLTYDLMF